MNKIIKQFWIVFFAISLSCAGSNAGDDITLEEKFDIGMRNLEKEKLLQAQLDFKQVVIRGTGSDLGDDAQYYLAESYYRNEEYLDAISEYEKLTRRMGFSPFVEDARFKICEAYRIESPKYYHDQEYTEKALERYQEFLDDFQRSKLKEEVLTSIELLREKLGLKLYETGILYMKMDEFESAKIALERVVDSYYDTEIINLANQGLGVLKENNSKKIKKFIRINNRLPKKINKNNKSNNRPKATGSPEIDNFKNAAFDLNDKIVELKDKLKSVSDGLAESNDVLAAIAAHSEGPLGWSRQQIAIAILKATQGPTFNVETNPAVEKVLTAFKEVEGSLQEKIIIAISKASEESDALVAIDMDKFITLTINYDPTKMIREKLGILKTGVVDGAEELKSVPDDLKAIGEQAKSLLASAGELPKAAKSLGFSKAPAALKSIKATTGVLKNIPNEVTAIGDESKKVMEEIDKVLKNIQNILSTTQ